MTSTHTLRISARFDSTCYLCSKPIFVGEMINYQPDAPKGKKVWHLDCNDSQYVRRQRAEEEMMRQLEALKVESAEKIGSFVVGQEVVYVGSGYRHHAVGDMDDDWSLYRGNIGVIKEKKERDGFWTLDVEFELMTWPGKVIANVNPRDLEGTTSVFKF